MLILATLTMRMADLTRIRSKLLYNQAGVISCVSLLTASHANVGNLKDSPSQVAYIPITRVHK